MLVLTWLIVSCCISENEVDWPMFHHDPQHTGYSSYMPYPLEKKWVYKDPKIRSFCTVSDKTLFVNQRHCLSAIDLIYGSLKWKFQPTKPGEVGIHISLYGYPAVSKNRIFVSATQGIICLNARTGEKLWYYTIEYIDVYSSPIVVDDYIIVGTGGYFRDPDFVENAMSVLCLDAKTGKKIWEYKVGYTVDSSPAYYNGKVYVNDGASNIYCLDVDSSELFWKKKLEWTIFSSLSLDGNKIFAGVHNGVLCLDIEKGDFLWHFDCGERVFETPLIAHQKIFFGTPDGKFYCVNAQTGDKIWDINTAQTEAITAVVASDKKVAFGNTEGILYIVDAESGEICEFLQLDEDQIDSLVLSDGKLICGQSGGTITCFGESNKGIHSYFPIFAIVIMVFTVLIILKFLRRKTLSDQ
jgi:outer membrane protein assembly factor BamB